MDWGDDEKEGKDDKAIEEKKTLDGIPSYRFDIGCNELS